MGSACCAHYDDVLWSQHPSSCRSTRRRPPQQHNNELDTTSNIELLTSDTTAPYDGVTRKVHCCVRYTENTTAPPAQTLQQYSWTHCTVDVCLCTAVSPVLRTVLPKGPGRVSSSLPGCFLRQRASPGLYRDSCRTHPGSGGVLSAGDAPSLRCTAGIVRQYLQKCAQRGYPLFILRET